MGILLAHVISLKIDVNKGIKAITDRICNKLNIDKVVMSEIQDRKEVEKELKDLNTLYSTISEENKLLYGYENSWRTSDELIDSLGVMIFNEGRFILGKPIELEGITTSEYVQMVDQCSLLSKKYIPILESYALEVS